MARLGLLFAVLVMTILTPLIGWALLPAALSPTVAEDTAAFPPATPIVEHRFTWAVAYAHGETSMLNGFAGTHVSQVTLRWHGGSQRITTHDGYFRGRVAIATNPAFRLLPFDLVATDSHGRRVGTQRILTSALYSDWNRVEPNLSTYRKAHGCNATPPRWRCLSR